MAFLNYLRISIRSSYSVTRFLWVKLTKEEHTGRAIQATNFTSQKYFIDKLKLLTVLAFLWPLKKKEENKKTEIKVLREADELFENGKYKHSYAVLCGLDNQKDVEVMWRKCRALYNMSTDPTSADTERDEFLHEAFDIIKDALCENFNHYAVHKWYALLLDAKSNKEGIKQRIKQLENVKMHLMKAAELNPKDATTLYMLGEWCYQITDMPWYQRKIAATLFASPPNSTYHEALDFFLKAEAAEPRFYSLNLLMLGKTYLKLGEDELAKTHLKAAAGYPAKTNDDHRANKEATDLLRKL